MYARTYPATRHFYPMFGKSRLLSERHLDEGAIQMRVLGEWFLDRLHQLEHGDLNKQGSLEQLIWN
jgi:hypothetical protein